MFSDYHIISHTNPGKEGKEKNSSRGNIHKKIQTYASRQIH